jgi:hypothetical protein
MRIEKVFEQIEHIAEQIAKESQIYELRELCIYAIFKANTRRELFSLMNAFDKKIDDYENGTMVNNLDYFQMDAFINTRTYELPEFQFKKSW